MQVFELIPDPDRFESLDLVDKSEWPTVRGLFQDGPVSDTWRPFRVEVFKEGKRKRRQGDYPSLGGMMPVFSQRAVEALRDILSANGELLPLHSEEGTYSTYNVVNVLDALDEERSDVSRVDENGNIYHISRYAFDGTKLHDATIFQIPQMGWIRTYVTDAFVQRVNEAGLQGFEFRLLWPLSEPEPPRRGRRRRPKTEKA